MEIFADFGPIFIQKKRKSLISSDGFSHELVLSTDKNL